MKGNSPESSFHHSKSRLSSPPAPVCLALLAPVGLDLCGAAPLIKTPIVPCFHAGAWEGERPCPSCLLPPPSPRPQKYSHILPLCMIYLLGHHLNQGRKSAEPAQFQDCGAYYVSTRRRFDLSGLMWCGLTDFSRPACTSKAFLQRTSASRSCSRRLQTWEMKSPRLLQRLK